MKDSPNSVKSYYLQDIQESSPPGICNLFAKHFSSVFIDDSALSLPSYNFSTSINISGCVLREHDVERKLNSLDPSKGTGPDEIPPMVLRHCSSLLAPHLTVIFNKLLEDGIFPDKLKTSYVVPIFKSADSANIKNYRPIVIQPALAKVFESLVLDSIAFSCRSLLNPHQHGFTLGRSTTTNLVLYEHFIQSAFRAGKQVDSVYLDFSKAFDSVSHRLLIAKLEAYGIIGSLLCWFNSYLSQRSLVVKYCGASSRPFLATSGVPQGSHLGPFLFTIFLNDIFDQIDTDCLTFADDIKVFTEVSCIQDCRRLQRCLREIENWCVLNSMKLNAEKCQIISFHRSSNFISFNYVIQDLTLSHVQTVRDLGVTLTTSLSQEAHINAIICKANKALGLIIRSSRYGLSVEAMRLLFTALVRSSLEYCCVVWCPYQSGHILQLEKVQERFLRVVGARLGFEYRTVPLKFVRDVLGLLPLESRRQLHDLVFLQRVLQHGIDSPELLGLIELRVGGRTRLLHLFNHRSSNSNYEQNSTIPRLHRLGNTMSPLHDFFTDSCHHLKREFLMYLQSSES